MTSQDLPIIGSTTLLTVGGINNIPAKIDTGADSSCIWASNIIINDQEELEFSLLGSGHPLYTGERLATSDFTVSRVRNSTGHVTIRYRVQLLTIIQNKKIRINYTLYDRSRNHFPALLGRASLNRKFLVDVSRTAVKRPGKMKNQDLISELKTNPREFHKKYMN